MSISEHDENADAPSPTSDEESSRTQYKQAAPPPCTCFCLANWIGQIAAPYVPKIPNTITTIWFRLPPLRTEIETGEEFWSANVNKKDYDCNTLQVLAVTPMVLNLVHNTYSRSRSRTLGWTGWGPWTAWTPFANTGNYTNAQALGTSAPPSLPECTAVGVPCP